MNTVSDYPETVFFIGKIGKVVLYYHKRFDFPGG